MAEVEKKTENLVYAKPKLITDNVMHYCPGCSHGTVHKLIAEVIEEMGLAEKTVGISPVAGPSGIHLSGRRRPGMYRYGRNHPCAEPR